MILMDKKESKHLYAQVVFPLPIKQEFTYRIPEALVSVTAVGSIIAAPFRTGIKTGFITNIILEKPEFSIKDIQDILYDEPVFSGELIQLARWMAEYYFVSFGEMLQGMLPVKLNRESVELITEGTVKPSEIPHIKLSAREEEILKLVAAKKLVTPQTIRRTLGRQYLYYTLDKLKRLKLISVRQVITEKKVSSLVRIFYKPLIALSLQKQEEVFSRAQAQKEVYTYILNHYPVARQQIVSKFSGRDTVLTALVEKGLLERYEQEVPRDFAVSARTVSDELPPLTYMQKEAADAVLQQMAHPKAKRFGVFLLYGVTGSGKTRVYLELISKTLERGEGVLFLVPEIALSTYFLAELKARFGDVVAVHHSRMSDGERYDSWRGLLSGEKRLVIGPRSAIFLPVKNIGLILVDEEHDPSYKQQESPPYYNARDVAVYRGQVARACVVLGSATPSMESFYNAQTGKYHLLELPERIDRTPLPDVRLVDLRSEPAGESLVFSKALAEEVETRLKQDEQVLLMLNRRGYSTFVQCKDCGYIETCNQCKITLTYHKKRNQVVCHFCGYSAKAPIVCQSCGGAHIRYSGIGTQQVEEALKQFLPGYQTTRMDLDTTRTKTAHQRITDAFERGTYDILVGTQMVAKGFDFGKVNLVGVISADTGLLLPDFRSSERTFQLLTQAAGRAGRRQKQGTVLIQTRHPEHLSLQMAKNHNYLGFYEQEAENRKVLNYPPFGRIILLRFIGRNDAEVARAALETGNHLRNTAYRQFLLGPAPAPIEKLRNNYRWHILLKSGKTADANGLKIRTVAETAQTFFAKHPLRRTVSMTIDIDPLNML